MLRHCQRAGYIGRNRSDTAASSSSALGVTATVSPYAGGSAKAGRGYPRAAGRQVRDVAGHATSSIASHGAAATAEGVSPAIALTSR